MTILVTGGSGQLGACVRQKLAKLGCQVIAPDHGDFDVADAEQVKAGCAVIHPSVIVHCAAYNQVDAAEAEPEKCFLTNTTGTMLLAENAARIGAYMIYISSDYVFDGKKRNSYEVSDEKKPLSVYGRSKDEGERAVLSVCAGSAVVRTSWLFGHGRHNFVESILNAAKGQDSIQVVQDQKGSPTYADDLAVLLADMVQKRCKGIFHATNEGECTRAEFARKILLLSGSSCRVEEVLSSQYPSAAHRPVNSILSKKSLDEAGLSRLPGWMNALERYLAARKEYRTI